MCEFAGTTLELSREFNRYYAYGLAAKNTSSED